MTTTKIEAFRDPVTNAVIRVEVIRDGTVIGGWRQPYPDVWAMYLRDKDDVRNAVDAAGAKRST